MFESVPLAEAAAHVAVEVAAFDVAGASDDELLQLVPLLAQAQRVVDAALGSSLGELDVRSTTDERFGHRTAAWFASTVNCSRAEARRRVQVGRRLARLELVRDALAEGDVSFDHARVRSELAVPRNAEVVARLQAEIVGLARVLPFERWRAEVQGLVDLADDDGGFRPGPESSTLRMTTGFGGSLEMAGTFTALDGAALRAAVEARADRLGLQFRLGVKAGTLDAVPTRAELLAQALAELVREGLVAGRTGSGPVTDLTLVAHASDPLGTSNTNSSNEDLSDQTVRTLCCDPVVRTVVLDSLGNPVDLGRATRIVPKGLRRALEVRDGGCVFPGCDAPASWCDAHHVVRWADGGATSAENLALLCRHHHGVSHRHGWTMTADPDRAQRFTWTRPDGHQIGSHRGSDHARSAGGNDPPVPLIARAWSAGGAVSRWKPQWGQSQRERVRACRRPCPCARPWPLPPRGRPSPTTRAASRPRRTARAVRAARR